MKILKFTVMLLTAVFAGFALGGCTVEESQGGDYGYVQFKLYKEASYSPASKAADIEFLGDICKARITLRYQGKTLNQTLVFSAGDAQKAEYGIRSEKLQLLAGDYDVVSFTVFDKNDNEGLSVYEIAEPHFSVVANGMTVHDLTVDSKVVPSRGNVNFTFVKDMSSFDVPDTKALINHTFDEAKYITVTVERTSNNQSVTFSTIPAKFSIHFNDEDNDANLYPEGYENYKDFGYQTSSLKTDSLLLLVAGDYRVRSYSLLDNYKTSFESREFPRSTAPVFSIEDNKVQNMCVPVALSDDAPYLQDYYALYEIWKGLDGPNWYYRGENYAPGTNWNFNKDPDLWGDQPGVRIHDNGRIASIDITDFGIKGELAPAIGQLTELVQFYISTHKDINYIDTEDPAELSRTRMERHKKYLRETHPLTQLSMPIAFGFKHKNESVPEIALHEKGLSEKEIAAVEGFNTAAWLGGGSMKAVESAGKFSAIPQTCGLTALPEELGNLTKLEYLYVANCPLEKIPSAEALSKMAALTDLEIYNTPKLELTDANIEALAAMPSLVSINFGENPQWTAGQCEKLFDALAQGPSHDKLQIIYFRGNHLNALLSKHFSHFPKLGLLDLQYNDIETVEAMGKEFAPVQLFLDYNKIKKFPNNDDGTVFCTIDDIESFSATHNEIEEFPNIFDKDNMFTIPSVDLSYNNIDRVAPGFVDKGINVKTLSLASNRFRTYPVEFSQSNSIVSIYNFRGNGMTELPKEAFAVEDDINGDYTIEGSRSNLRYTQTFDFSYNRLSDIPVTFADGPFPYLYSVDLSFNAFKEFPFEPLNYTNLTAYAVRSQRDNDGKRILRDWPDNLLNHRGLRGFYIGGNDYRRIPENPSERISQLIYYFDISDNPNLEFDASSICTAWRAGAYFLFYDKTQKIINCPQMLN